MNSPKVLPIIAINEAEAELFNPHRESNESPG
jgi:hypothetical protein